MSVLFEHLFIYPAFSFAALLSSLTGTRVHCPHLSVSTSIWTPPHFQKLFNSSIATVARWSGSFPKNISRLLFAVLHRLKVQRTWALCTHFPKLLLPLNSLLYRSYNSSGQRRDQGLRNQRCVWSPLNHLLFRENNFPSASVGLQLQLFVHTIGELQHLWEFWVYRHVYCSVIKHCLPVRCIIEPCILWMK